MTYRPETITLTLSREDVGRLLLGNHLREIRTRRAAEDAINPLHRRNLLRMADEMRETELRVKAQLQEEACIDQ